jgi:hypothetical protein
MKTFKDYVENYTQHLSEEVNTNNLEDVNFKNLEKSIGDYISKKIDKKATFKAAIVKGRRQNNIEIESEGNLATNMNPRMFKTLRIEGMAIPRPEASGEFWLNLRYYYEFIDGGSNGCSIADVTFNMAGEILTESSKF